MTSLPSEYRYIDHVISLYCRYGLIYRASEDGERLKTTLYQHGIDCNLYGMDSFPFRNILGKKIVTGVSHAIGRDLIAETASIFVESSQQARTIFDLWKYRYLAHRHSRSEVVDWINTHVRPHLVQISFLTSGQIRYRYRDSANEVYSVLFTPDRSGLVNFEWQTSKHLVSAWRGDCYAPRFRYENIKSCSPIKWENDDPQKFLGLAWFLTTFPHMTGHTRDIRYWTCSQHHGSPKWEEWLGKFDVKFDRLRIRIVTHNLKTNYYLIPPLINIVVGYLH